MARSNLCSWALDCGNVRRKVITSVNAGNTSFTVGGASPVGTFVPGSGGYYVVALAFLAADYFGTERITSHKVGRPFGESAGRKKALLSLRL